MEVARAELVTFVFVSQVFSVILGIFLESLCFDSVFIVIQI